MNFLSGADGWTIDQNYSTKSAKIRNSSGFSQQLAGLFLQEGIHLPKVGSLGTKPAAIPVASTTALPPVHADAQSDSADDSASAAENDPAIRRSSGKEQQQGSSSGKHELVRCGDGHFRLLPKNGQMSNSIKSASERQALAHATPQPKKRRNVRNAESRVGDEVADCDSRLQLSATKQTPPAAKRRLFRGDGGQSDAEQPCKQEAEQKRVRNFRTDCPKTRRNADAFTRQARGSSPDNVAAFAGAHPKSKPRCPVAAAMDNYSRSSDDERPEEGYLAFEFAVHG